MIDMSNDIESTDFTRLFQLLSEVNKSAESLKLSTLAHLTDMALLQLSLDWEGLQAEEESKAKLNAILRSKTKAVLDKSMRN